MCFSAEASFTASGLLAITGIILLKRFPADSKTALALIPLFFAIQQFSEGMLWVAFNNPMNPQSWTPIFHYIYLFFAYIFWPIWIPFAFRIPETVYWKRNVIDICFIGGILILLYTSYNLYLYGPGSPRVINHSIQYGDSQFSEKLVYSVITLIPFLVSSIPGMRALGILIAAAFIIANAVYYYAFASVWCFFAAIICLGLIFTLRKPNTNRSS